MHQDGFSYYRAWATILLGWASAEEGSLEAGIRQVGEGIRDLNTTGAELRLPYYLRIQADLHCRRGEFDEASAVLSEALTFSARNGECWHDRDLYFVEGDLLLTASQGGAAKAAASYRRAFEIARDQGSRRWSYGLRCISGGSRPIRADAAQARDLSRRSTAGSPKA